MNNWFKFILVFLIGIIVLITIEVLYTIVEIIMETSTSYVALKHKLRDVLGAEKE